MPRSGSPCRGRFAVGLTLGLLKAFARGVVFGAPLVLAGFSACSFPAYELPAVGQLPLHCRNRQKDVSESDYDCGGPCAACQAGQACLVPSDCASSVCLGRTCAAPTCSDGVINGRESDLDCGEACAPNRCARGNACRYDEDCNSFRCEDGQCSEAACDDELHNGVESDVDCGGACAPCLIGQACGADSDCETQICSAARCAPDTCRNHAQDLDETDEDCGGPDCGPCAGGDACERAEDCLSGSCTKSVCDAASCRDGQHNQDETDIDCGGRGCPGCADGLDCMTGSDCASAVCAEHTCRAPTCEDVTQNGEETGVDCGGDCEPCGPAPECTDGPRDCDSKVCTDGRCAPARCDDGVQNGSETDVDCGPGCAACAVRKNCTTNDDCATGKCDHTCLPTLEIELRCRDAAAQVTCIKPQYKLTNLGPTAIALADYSLRYYYSKEGSMDESFRCFYIDVGDCNQVAPGHFGAVKPKATGADRYVEVSFTSGARMLDPGKSFDLQTGICYPDGGDRFTQTGDYSFDPSTVDVFKETSRVTVYKRGVLVLGSEP